MTYEQINIKKTSGEDLVNLILQRYTPSFHYLQSFERIDDKNIKGSFLVNGSAHVADRDMFHLAITETQMCLNQFFQIQMAHLLETGHFEGIRPIKFEKYWPNSDEFLFVVDQHLKFKKPIQPDKEFIGHLEMLDEHKSRKGYYHMNFNFDFDNRAHHGKLRLAFNPAGLAKKI